MTADQHGRYGFWSVKPAAYPIPGDGSRRPRARRLITTTFPGIRTRQLRERFAQRR